VRRIRGQGVEHASQVLFGEWVVLVGGGGLAGDCGDCRAEDVVSRLGLVQGGGGDWGGLRRLQGLVGLAVDNPAVVGQTRDALLGATCPRPSPSRVDVLEPIPVPDSRETNTAPDLPPPVQRISAGYQSSM
jgi:hypothetical protein